MGVYCEWRNEEVQGPDTHLVIRLLSHSCLSFPVAPWARRGESVGRKRGPLKPCDRIQRVIIMIITQDAPLPCPWPYPPLPR